MTDEKPKMIAVAQIPDDQRFTVVITPMPGRLMSLNMIGQHMSNMAILMRDCHREGGGKVKNKEAISLVSAKFNEDGSFEYEAAILPVMRE